MYAQKLDSTIVSTDITNFWYAYDKITGTNDSTLQYSYLNQLFIRKGSPGLRAIMQARNYTLESYMNAIKRYPRFWNSIRENTLETGKFADSIAKNIQKLRTLYPDLRPAKIYFTIGAFKTGGTTQDGMVLIGSEIALADERVETSEFPSNYNFLKTFFKSNPIDNVVFNNIHEYVHTQQKTTDADYLLAQCVLEGVAEFIAEKATTKHSTSPAINYGRRNDEKIKSHFILQMFNFSNGFWLYNNDQNIFGVRDLGYYVGYAICEKFYLKANNKLQAIKHMIELDYNNFISLSNFVDQSTYFGKQITTLKKNYEDHRPFVKGIRPFTNNSSNVAVMNTEIIVEFSTPMDIRFKSFSVGPLGKANLLKFKFKGFSSDGKYAKLEVALKPSQVYQVVLGEGFRNKNSNQLKPYLLSFETESK